MPRAVHRGRVRLQSYVDPATADRVDRFCAAMGMSESALVKSALDQYLAGTSDAALVLRRLDRLGRAVKRSAAAASWTTCRANRSPTTGSSTPSPRRARSSSRRAASREHCNRPLISEDS